MHILIICNINKSVKLKNKIKIIDVIKIIIKKWLKLYNGLLNVSYYGVYLDGWIEQFTLLIVMLLFVINIYLNINNYLIK
jgi:hypothetical protein